MKPGGVTAVAPNGELDPCASRAAGLLARPAGEPAPPLTRASAPAETIETLLGPA
jgi:hypothetical protein